MLNPTQAVDKLIAEFDLLALALAVNVDVVNVHR